MIKHLFSIDREAMNAEVVERFKLFSLSTLAAEQELLIAFNKLRKSAFYDGVFDYAEYTCHGQGD